jgi:putative oxidoreductase
MFVQFWSFKGPADARVMVRNLFVGNVAVVGGLLYVAAVGAGRLAFVDL